ncbi:MAG: PAS-domain containing protein [Pseudomonadota bacterium]
MSVIEMLFMFGCAIVSVAMGVVYMRQNQPQMRADAGPDTRGLHFLFYDLDLQHMSSEAQALLDVGSGETDWHALRARLLSRFPGLPDGDALRDIDSLTLHAASPSDPGILRLNREDYVTRVTIEDEVVHDIRSAHLIKALEAEMDTLRPAATDAPYPIWLAGPDGGIRWCNTAYAALAEDVHPGAAPASCTLFDLAPTDLHARRAVRVPVRVEHNQTIEWYNVTATQSGRDVIYHAVDINAVIQAEVAQRNFVQTLAKTFAQLSIGLAIFDRNGQLALFNPALVDLTSLPAEFLSARPDLLSFFDRLRDNRVMPEPKNYNSWRQEISEVIAAATNGDYQETWSLDSGHTYRVSGRPHPDGAVAFLIEDITAEISLTRNFRAELELGQSLMDTFEDALVVFSSAGVLTFCNAAYRAMWKMDPDNSFADVTIVDAIKEWQQHSAPDPAWGDMRDFVMRFGERAPWDALIAHNSLGRYDVHIAPITSGATVIRFREHVPHMALEHARA